MKFLIVADMHLAYTSSILPIYNKDSKYTTRLQYMIDTVKWYTELAKKENVDYIINLGDLTDSNILRSEELTALAEAYKCRDNKSIPEIYITGNHDTLTNDHRFSATSILSNIPNFTVITEPCKMTLTVLRDTSQEDANVTFLPYINWKNIDFEFLKKWSSDILFSHIDIMGSSLYQAFGNDIGIEPNELCMFFDKIYNGHIHLQEKLKCNKDNIWNVGSLTSISFSDSNKYIPGAHIVNTDTNEFKTISNPYNILFRKFKVTSIMDCKSKLQELDKNYKYVIRLEIPFNLKQDIENLINSYDNIIANRLILDRKKISLTEDSKANLEVIDKNNIKYKFIDFIRSYSDENDKELKYPVNSYINLISKM